MAARRLNARKAKIRRAYTVGETALLFNVHRNTVRAWLRQGLPALTNGKPVLIHGSELKRFLLKRQKSRKRPCGIGHLYCFRCRSPRAPAGKMADFIPYNGADGNLEALCPDCGCVMYRRIRIDRIAVLFPEIDVQIRQAHPRLSRKKHPSVNCDIRTKESA